MTGPDFIIIGAMKCGTTTLQDQLAAQPGVFMTTPKEPNYFSNDEVFANGPDWYSSLFDAAAAHDLKGEASTHYTKLPTYPDTIARLQAAVPAPKLIYMIRNPIDRAVSHYIHGWSRNEIADPFLPAFDSHPELIDYGRYAMQITPFLKAFGPEHLHLTSLEQLKADPQMELSAIGAFLGLSTPLEWHEKQEAQNVSAARFRPLPFSRLLVDNPVARALRHSLVPKALREKLRQARSIQSRPELTPALRARLETAFLSDRAELARLFPDHPALTLCYPFAP